MKISARDIDHLVFSLSDPGLAASRLEQMGFTLTPDGTEPRCVCFAPHRDDIPSYLELAAGDTASVSLAMNVAELQGEERSIPGKPSMAISSRCARWSEKPRVRCPGLPCATRRRISFPSRNGLSTPTARWQWSRFTSWPTIRALWRATCAWPGTAKARKSSTAATLVKTGEVELLLWSPAAYQLEYKSIEAMAPEQRPAVVGLTLAVERARPLQALLRANNVPFGIADNSRTVVAPEQVGGLMIEFIPQGGAEA